MIRMGPLRLDSRSTWTPRSVRVYIEPRDWWVGYYRGDRHHYVCPLTCVVIRWRRSTTDQPLEDTP